MIKMVEELKELIEMLKRGENIDKIRNGKKVDITDEIEYYLNYFKDTFKDYEDTIEDYENTIISLLNSNEQSDISD